MRIPRIYEPAALQVGQTLALSEDGANHIGRVLRTQNIDPRAAPASVRVGSRRRSATMADATVLPVDGGREFITR